VSAGAIIALPLALGMFDKLYEETIHIKRDEMFTSTPTNKKGKISLKGWIRAIEGVIKTKETDRYSFGLQDTRHFLISYITEEMFNSYKKNSSLPDILVMTVNMTSGLPEVYSAKELTYKLFVEAVEKSCHIPIMTDAVEDEVDGGVWAHNPEWYLLHKGLINPSEIISIYSREKVFKIASSVKWKENVFENITRVLGVFNVALSTCGQGYAYWFCKANKIKHLQLFCPQILDELYDFDEEQLEEAARKTQISIIMQINTAWTQSFPLV
jgi:predicted acylesterase/phospholipase RssA